MTKVLLTSPSDSPGYTRYLLAEAVGETQAGESVVADVSGMKDEETGEAIEQVEIVLHGQREFDLPDKVTSIKFPDGSTYKPK